jgi:hypothetical protein
MSENTSMTTAGLGICGVLVIHIQLYVEPFLLSTLNFFKSISIYTQNQAYMNSD